MCTHSRNWQTRRRWINDPRRWFFHPWIRTKEGTIMEIEWSELCPVSSVTVMIYESYPRDALKLEWQLIGRIARNLLSIVTNVFSRRMECGWLLNRLNADSPISFSLHARESSVQASDKWYLIKLYCANNDHNAFGSTRPDFYSSILDNWYFRGHPSIVIYAPSNRAKFLCLPV